MSEEHQRLRSVAEESMGLISSDRRKCEDFNLSLYSLTPGVTGPTSRALGIPTAAGMIYIYLPFFCTFPYDKGRTGQGGGGLSGESGRKPPLSS